VAETLEVPCFRYLGQDLVAPLVTVLLVVGHLSANRAEQGLLGNLGAELVGEVRPGRLEVDQGAEGVEEDRHGRSSFLVQLTHCQVVNCAA